MTSPPDQAQITKSGERRQRISTAFETLTEPDQKTAMDQDVTARLARAEAELAAEREKVKLLERYLDDVRRMLPPPDPKPRRRWWPF